MLHVEPDDLTAIFFGAHPKRIAAPTAAGLSQRHLSDCLCDICDICDKRAPARVSGRFEGLRQAATFATNGGGEALNDGFVANVATCRKGHNSPESEHWRHLSQMSQMSQRPAAKTDVEPPAAVPAAVDPDRWCWPHSDAMNSAELAEFVTRRSRLMRWGWVESAAEVLAERLAKRGRDADDRVSCTDCQHYRPGRCGNHGLAGLRVPDLSRDLAGLLQRCPGFAS